MGQAKLRGSHAERVELAKARIEALKPTTITCNNCRTGITDIQVMDSRGLAGVRAAYAGMCQCGHTTFAFQGDPEAVAAAMVVLEKAMEGDAKFGSQPTLNR
jgi:hypothetical protein